MKTPAALSIAVAATLALYIVPGGRTLGRPLVLLSTLVHELGHGLTALLVGGSFKRLHLFADASGVAMFEGRTGRVARALVAAGGPLGPPIAATGLFFAGTTARSAHIALFAIAGIMLVVCAIWVRNAFGVAFVLLLGSAIGALAWFSTDRVARIACAFLAVQMTLSVFSRADYLFTSRARTKDGLMPSDTAQIANALFFPHWFWGGLIALISLAVLGLGIWTARTMR